MQHRSTIWRLTITWSTLFVAGCYSPYIRTPNFAHPGTAAEQRADAERFDPYPDPDAGPEVVGGRPLGYTRPLTDAEWSRRYGAPPGALQPSSVTVIPSAPVITSPYPPSAPPVYPAAPPVPNSTFQVQPRAPY